MTFGYENVDIIHYETKIDFNDLFVKLKNDFNTTNVTIQSGGKDTPTLIDGASLLRENELDKLGILELIDCKVLNASYINLKYKVIS